MIISLKAKQKTVKILEDNIGQNLENLEYDNDFITIYQSIPEACSMKEIIAKLN